MNGNPGKEKRAAKKTMLTTKFGSIKAFYNALNKSFSVFLSSKLPKSLVVSRRFWDKNIFIGFFRTFRGKHDFAENPENRKFYCEKFDFKPKCVLGDPFMPFLLSNCSKD